MKKQKFQQIQAASISPAKVILSGEYSILYGASALAMAIASYLKTSVKIINVPTIRILQEKSMEYSIEECRMIAQRIDQKYNAFLDGHLPITDVLSHSDDLILYILNRHFHNYSSQGISLNIHSAIPIGSGFGSSSAIISALSLVLRKIMGKPFDGKKEFIADTIYIERLQHGKSGLIDSTTIIEGGIVYIKPSITIKQDKIIGKWWAVDTGRPESSTGECVAFVDKHFSKSNIWSEFNAVTDAMVENIQDENREKIGQTIRTNHLLLQSLDIVPSSISQLIRSIEERGGSAKISGAGSIRGESAGLVLVYDYNPQECASFYGYTCYPIQGEKNGTRLTEDSC
ncbi:MAG: GHMP kinase [Candidatus Liberibacter ctenarytainae]|uniref:GHMP kinase n=1 Tax=Candidatus Liberibacter ctenarytainae TaxID=2020335 RepID=A0A937AQE0_9HYPH|nr:GHMP kinase [Candidatus Liberibacter ctenarytainae]